MKKLFILGFSALLLVSNSLVAFGQNSTRGVGIIEVTSEYITFRDVTRTRRTIDDRSAQRGGGSAGSFGGIEYYTVREQVIEDRNFLFFVYRDDREVYRGFTPVRVSNFDTGVTYTIVWNDVNGRQQRGTFVISNARPFTRYINLE